MIRARAARDSEQAQWWRSSSRQLRWSSFLIFWKSSFKVSAAKKSRKVGVEIVANDRVGSIFSLSISGPSWRQWGAPPLLFKLKLPSQDLCRRFAFYMLVRAPPILFTRQSSITGFVLEIFHFHFLNFYFSSQWAATFPFLIFDFNILQQDNQCLFHELQRMHAKISAKFLKFLEGSSRFKF